MSHISYDDFMKVEMLLGKVVRAEPFPKARNPAIKLWIDFGETVGIKKSSSQITDHYSPESMVGQYVVCVTNFPPRQVADFMSEVLTLGVYAPDQSIRLMCVDAPETLALGSRIL